LPGHSPARQAVQLQGELTVKPVFKFRKRATDVVCWALGTLALSASCCLFYEEGYAIPLLLFLAMTTLPFFPGTDGPARQKKDISRHISG